MSLDQFVKSSFASAACCLALALGLLGCASRMPGPVAHPSLADTWLIISNKEFVDLTHTFSPTTPVWQGFGPAIFSPAADPATARAYTIEKDGHRSLQYKLVGQYGTHIDPPAHFDSNGKTLDQLPVKNMLLPLVVFDITPKLENDPNHALGIEDILAWEKVHGRVPSRSE